MNVARMVAACLIVCSCAAVVAAQEGKSPPPPALRFLEVGHDYVILFAEGSNVCECTRHDVTPTSLTTADGRTHPGKPATWTTTLSNQIFTVVAFSGGQWVLVEHPASPDDFIKWSLQRRAKAQLTDAHVQQLEADAAGRERLLKLRKAAGVRVHTSKTWVNLAHAVAIADLPTDLSDPEMHIQSVDVQWHDVPDAARHPQ